MSFHQAPIDLQIHHLGIGLELITLAQVQYCLMETWLRRKAIVRFQTLLIVRNRIQELVLIRRRVRYLRGKVI